MRAPFIHRRRGPPDALFASCLVHSPGEKVPQAARNQTIHCCRRRRARLCTLASLALLPMADLQPTQGASSSSQGNSSLRRSSIEARGALDENIAQLNATVRRRGLSVAPKRASSRGETRGSANGRATQTGSSSAERHPPLPKLSRTPRSPFHSLQQTRTGWTLRTTVTGHRSIGARVPNEFHSGWRRNCFGSVRARIALAIFVWIKKQASESSRRRTCPGTRRCRARAPRACASRRRPR